MIVAVPPAATLVGRAPEKTKGFTVLVPAGKKLRATLVDVEIAAAEKVTALPEIDEIVVPAGNGPVTTMPTARLLTLVSVTVETPSVVAPVVVVTAETGSIKLQPLRFNAALPVLLMTNCFETGVPM